VADHGEVVAMRLISQEGQCIVLLKLWHYGALVIILFFY